MRIEQIAHVEVKAKNSMKPNFISEDDFAAMTKRVGFVEQLETKQVRGGVAIGGKAEKLVTHQRTRNEGSRIEVRLSPASNPAPSPFTLTLTGQVPSGKNQVQLLWRNGKVMKYPNKTFTAWRQQSCLQIHGECFHDPNISRPVRLTCVYTPGDLRTRDVSGQLDALFHLLVYAKVLKDDGLVHDVTWRRQPMNRKAPKVEMLVEVL